MSPSSPFPANEQRGGAYLAVDPVNVEGRAPLQVNLPALRGHYILQTAEAGQLEDVKCAIKLDGAVIEMNTANPHGHPADFACRRIRGEQAPDLPTRQRAQ